MCFALGIKRQVKGGWISVGDTPLCHYSLSPTVLCLCLASSCYLLCVSVCVCCTCLCVCGCISEAFCRGLKSTSGVWLYPSLPYPTKTRTQSFKKKKKPVESRASKPQYCPVFVFHSAGGANVQVQSHLAFYIGPRDFNSSVFIIANAAIHWTVSLVPSWHFMSNNS